MYQRDERLTGDPYKANVSKAGSKYILCIRLCKRIQTDYLPTTH